MAETALARRYRLSKELRDIRHTENAQGVNQTTGKRAKRTKENVNNVAEIEIPQTAGGGNFLELDPGTYDAIVANIEEVENPFEEGKTQLQITFDIPGYANEDGSVCEKRAWANPVFNPQSKLYKWVTAINGATPTAGEPFRTSALVGKSCRLFINTAQKADGSAFSKVVDVLGPLKAATANAQAAKKPGLVAALKKDGPPAGTKVSDPTDIGACVVCDEPGTAFSGKGKPLCDSHAEQAPVELAM